ncbi:MAG: hypothetical protein ACE5EC_02230, partial [Phycisphaerae bacterium]
SRLDAHANRMASEQERAHTLLRNMENANSRIGAEEAARKALISTRDAAEETRQALEAMEGSLNGQLEHRRDLIHRIDQQLHARQIQLVTDILQAEGGHLELTTALSGLEENLSSIRGILPVDVGERRMTNRDWWIPLSR